MTHHENVKILAFVGMTGSGKSAAVDYFREKGFPKVDFSTIPYEIMAERGIPKGEENEKKFRVEIREAEGNDVYAKRVVRQIYNLLGAGQHRIVLGGLYTWEEYRLLQHEFPGEQLVLAAIVAPKKRRYKWLASREDRPQSPEVSAARDQNETESLHKGDVIANADYFIANEGSIEDFYTQLDELALEIEF